MTNRVTAQTETEIFALDVSDATLERAAAFAAGQQITIGACTHWYYCNWPMLPSERAAPRRED